VSRALPVQACPPEGDRAYRIAGFAFPDKMFHEETLSGVFFRRSSFVPRGTIALDQNGPAYSVDVEACACTQPGFLEGKKGTRPRNDAWHYHQNQATL